MVALAHKTKVLSLFIIILTFSAGTYVHASSLSLVHGSYRMLFEVDSTNSAEWDMTIGALAHIVKKIGSPPAHLEVLAWGPGLRMLLKHSADSMEIAILEMRGVKFMACETSMYRLNINKKQLVTGVKVVSGGMTELMKLHNEGWAEVKM